MSSVSEITSLSDQAIAWVILLHSGGASEQDRINAQEWRNRSHSHQKAYAEAEQLWVEMGDALRQQPSGVPASAVNSRKRPSVRWAIGLAISLTLLAVLNPFMHFGDRWLSDYVTRVGEQKRLTLSDGSQVILNTDTAIAVEWSESARRVRLLRGQAQFRVAKDPRRSFEVLASDICVKALGTVFEVQEESQGVRVSVLEHAVSIKIPVTTNLPENARVGEGQQVFYNFEKGLETITRIDLKQQSAWQRGKLIFKNRRLAEVVAELNRYYPGKIVLTNGGLPNLRVTGVFPLDDPVAVLSMLEQSLPLKVSRITPGAGA